MFYRMIPLFSLFYSPIDQTKILINNKLYELRSIKSISMQRFAPIDLSIDYLINLGCRIMIKMIKEGGRKRIIYKKRGS